MQNEPTRYRHPMTRRDRSQRWLLLTQSQPSVGLPSEFNGAIDAAKLEEQEEIAVAITSTAVAAD